MKKIILLVIIVISSFVGCSSSKHSTKHRSNSHFKVGTKTKGIASWYGDQFHGKLTASGEKYNMYKLTAANKTLPFGTIVKVTNLDNGKSVKVKINDRGPYVKGRLIDLSRAAFKKIAPSGAGIIHVEMTILDTSHTFRYKH